MPDPWRRLAAEAIQSGSKRGLQIEHGGRTFFFAIVPISDAAYVNLYSQDITDLKQAEMALRESEAKYRTLFEDSPDAMSVTQAGKIVDVNPAWCRLHGYDEKDAAIGLDIINIIHPDDRRILLERRTRPVGDLKRGYAIRDFRKDGSVIEVEVYSSRISIAGQEAILTSVRDISARKQAEREHEKLRDQLFQAQKLETVGRLAGGIVHDFNNLLTAVQGFTELAMGGLDETDPLHEDLKHIQSATLRAAGIVRQLLLFSRQQPMEFTRIDINRTIDNFLKMLNRLIGEDVTIVTQLSPGPCPAWGDAAGIEQVIMNLVINARDAMPEGGTLTVRAENITLDEKQCKAMSEAQPGAFVCISVGDTGEGIDEEIMRYIFEPFFSTKETGKGTGLGLSVAYGVVKKHNGWIDVRSKRGKGSTFKIYLPSASEAAPCRAEDTLAPDELRGHGERILVIEDEEEVRRAAARLLTGNGYQVVEAADGKEAQNAFEKHGGNFDLVFSDVVLPDQTALELIDTLLSHSRNIRVLLTSGYTDEKSQWAVIRKRGFRFVNKPYKSSDLFQAVRDTPAFAGA